MLGKQFCRCAKSWGLYGKQLGGQGIKSNIKCTAVVSPANSSSERLPVWRRRLSTLTQLPPSFDGQVTSGCSADKFVSKSGAKMSCAGCSEGFGLRRFRKPCLGFGLPNLSLGPFPHIWRPPPAERKSSAQEMVVHHLRNPHTRLSPSSVSPEPLIL